MPGSQEKPSGRLGLPIVLTVWFIAIIYPFKISWWVNFVEAVWALSIRVTVSIYHCEITLIHFIKVAKKFKSKYESPKDKEIYIGCYQKPYSKKTLFFFFNRKRKIKLQIGTSLYSLWNNSYSLNQSNSKRFQRQFNALRNLFHAQNSLPLETNLFYASVFITVFAYSENNRL